jgi:hypothetical protein
VALVWAVRILLYAQLLLGFDRFSRGGSGLTQDLHLVFGVIIAALALVAFRPVPGLREPGPRQAARFGPLAPLAIGLFFRATGMVLTPLVVLHVILAFAVVAFVEVAAARQKRWMADPTGSAAASGPVVRR